VYHARHGLLRTGIRAFEYPTLVDSIPALIHTARPDGYLDYFNKPWLEYLGVTLDKVTGWNWTAVVHPEDVEGIVAKWRACLATGEVFEYETRVRRANGEYRWMFHRKVPLRDANGNIVKWYGSSLDIEDRKRAEEELRRSEFYLSEGSVLPTWVAGFWMLRVVSLTGRTNFSTFMVLTRRKEGPSFEEYLASIHPQDREFMRSLINRMIAEASGCDVTKRIVRPCGEVRYVRCVGVPIVENGTLKRIVGSAIDVTEHELLTQELRRREAYLTEAQKLSHTGSFGCRLSTGEMFWSEETFRIYGYDRSIQPAVERVLDRVHPEDRVLVQERMNQANRDEKDCSVECRLLLPDGSVKHVCIVARASKNESGTTEFIGAVMDVTAHKHAEEELQQLVDFVGQIITVLSLSGKIIYANRVAREYTGLTLDEYRSVDVIARVIHPDDMERMRAVREHGLSANNPFEIESRTLGRAASAGGSCIVITRCATSGGRSRAGM